MGKSYEQLSANLRGFNIEEYIIFYYPREDGIDIARVISRITYVIGNTFALLFLYVLCTSAVR